LRQRDRDRERQRDRETDTVGGRVRAGMRREKKETKRCKRYTDIIIERDNERRRSGGAIQRERSGRERERERERESLLETISS
jgi:hypothetical protein